ncbi:hypothetical protein ECE50_014580 [Chitinophaga sp. Mgbs1]|uniref:Copper-binding protein MbnP-like domain-containing protein n=1 Tax=Chitinophaga solisilvae TaxID=1233460 RepID=A0A9Q5GM23_9BACT|nr:hypothetical protein [Chitinophaga solisilvae]
MILRIFTIHTVCFLMICLLSCGLFSCSKSNSGGGDPPPAPVTYASLQLYVTHVMNDQPLQRNQEYTNPSGEKFTITRFRYYLSNFAFVDESGRIIKSAPSYFLLDDAIDSTRQLQLDSIPAGRYTAVRLLIGVDSARNNSGVQSGALAPEHGLFWTWNSGYIMAQLEGTAPVINSASHEFQFHVGGYKPPYSVLQPVTIPLPQPLTIAAGKLPQLHLQANAGKWFTPSTISFTKMAVIMAPGNDAMQLAANYQHMFTVKSIVNGQ